MKKQSQPSLLLVSVSEPYRNAFRKWARQNRYELIACSLDEFGILAEGPSSFALVILEAPGVELLGAFERLRAKLVGPSPIVALGADVTVQTAVALMSRGARTVLELPTAAADVVAQSALHVSLDTPGEAARKFVGESLAIRQIRREVEAISPMQSTVLISGETGTGKGIVARLLHDLSERKDRPFVHVDCGALAGSVIESELFGHERGAFTGAEGERIGRFEAAADGTLFLDEIGELDFGLQRKLLRVLQDCTFERLGGTTSRRTRARVVAASNRDLDAEVRAGTFRADLLYRLNVFHIEVPPLRLRLDDIPGLVRFGLDELSSRLQITSPTLSDSAYARLASYDWPGNVRELMNVLERLVVRFHAGLLDGPSVADALDLEIGRPKRESPPPLELPLLGSEEERELLKSELLAAGGNVSRVARRLGIARGTLRYRMKIQDLEDLVPTE